MSKRRLWLGIAALASVVALLALLKVTLWQPPAQNTSGTLYSRTPFWTLQVGAGEVKSGPGLVARAIARELSGSGGLEEGYPQEGRLELVDSGEGPGMKRAVCLPGEGVGERRGCLLLDGEGDLLEIDLWDQPNALLFDHQVYLLEPGARLDRDVTPRVTVRFFGDPQRWLLRLYQTVDKALLALGAVPFSPQ